MKGILFLEEPRKEVSIHGSPDKGSLLMEDLRNIFFHRRPMEDLEGFVLLKSCERSSICKRLAINIFPQKARDSSSFMEDL